MNDRPEPRARNDATFLLIAGGLLVLILALLAGLWLKASRRAAAVEDQLRQFQKRDAAMAELRRMLQSQPLIAGVNRDALATREAVLDGRRVQVLRMPAEMAGKMGLAPGDVVVVDPAPSTAPATGPAPPKPAGAG